MDELNKERIKLNIEIIKLLTLLLLTTGGACIALVIEQPGGMLRKILGVAGVTFAVTCGILALFTYKNTIKKLR